MSKIVRKLFKDRGGATAIEYGPIAAIAAPTGVGGSPRTMFGSVPTTLTAAVPASP